MPAILLLSLLPMSEPEHVDVLERRYVYDRDGELLYSQYIGRQWDEHNGRYQSEWWTFSENVRHGDSGEIWLRGTRIRYGTTLERHVQRQQVMWFRWCCIDCMAEELTWEQEGTPR